MKKLTALLLALTLFFALVLAGCSASNETQEANKTPSNLTPVKVAYFGGGLCDAPFYAAYEKGFFKKNGLDAELVKVDFNTLKEGVATGKVAAVTTSWGSLKAVEQGLNLKVTAGLHAGCVQGVAAKDSPINTPADLKGKRIGVEAIGGQPMTTLIRELTRLGIDPERDVSWKAYPSPQLQQALEKGEIDAYVTWDPIPEIALQEGKVKRIFSTAASAPYNQEYCCYLGINGDLVKKDPQTAAALTRAILEGAEWAREHPQELAALALEKGYISGDSELNARLIQNYHYAPGWDVKDQLTNIARELKKAGVFEAGTDVEKFVNDTFVPLAGVALEKKGS